MRKPMVDYRVSVLELSVCVARILSFRGAFIDLRVFLYRDSSTVFRILVYRYLLFRFSIDRITHFGLPDNVYREADI